MRGEVIPHAGAALGGPLFTAANLALCAVAAAIPTDEVIVTMTGVDRAAFAPTFHTSLLAAALWTPVLLSRPWLGRHLAPVLLLAGAMLAGVLTLLVAAAIGDLRIGPELTPYQPFKLAVLGTLFATAALDPRWRRRLRFSYMAGWTLLVGYAAWGIATGRAAFTRHAGDIVRVSVAGLNENQQAILVATGMVVAFAELLLRPRSMRVMPWILALVAGAGVFVFSVSRGASVGLAAAAVFVFGSVAAGGRLRRGTLPALALASLCALGAVVASASVASAANSLAERFAATVRQREVGDRDRLAGEAVRLALREPWSGVGFGRTAHHLGGDPHNSYLKIVAEGGAAAGLLLAGGLLAVAGVLARVRSQDRDLGAAGALVLLLVVALVGQALLRPPFWFFLAITTAAAPGRARG